MDFQDSWVAAFVLAVIVLIVWLIYADAGQWKDFANAHHCQEVGEISASVTSNGSIVPGKTGYKCDNGKTYWR